MRWLTLLVAAALASLLSPGAPLAAQAQTSVSFVKVTASADKVGADGKQVAIVTLTIDDRWEVYANPVGHADLAHSQLKLEVSARAKPKSVRIDYPVATLIKDRVFGDYKVYRTKAVVKAFVERAPGDTSPLQVAVSFRAIHSSICVVPSTVRLDVR